MATYGDGKSTQEVGKDGGQVKDGASQDVRPSDVQPDDLPSFAEEWSPATYIPETGLQQPRDDVPPRDTFRPRDASQPHDTYRPRMQTMMPDMGGVYPELSSTYSYSHASGMRLEHRCELLFERVRALEKDVSEWKAMAQDSFDYIKELEMRVKSRDERLDKMTEVVDGLTGMVEDLSSRLIQLDDAKEKAEGQRLRLKPQPYDGTGDLGAWLEAFEEVADIQSWSARTKAVMLRTSLTGTAAVLVASAEHRDYDGYVSALKAGLEESREQCVASLTSYKQGEKESIGDLSVAITRLGDLAYGHASSEAKQIGVRDAFVNALRDVEVRRTVRDFGPKTLREAQEIAKRLTLNRQLAASRKEGKVARIKEHPKTEELSKKLDQLTADVKQLRTFGQQGGKTGSDTAGQGSLEFRNKNRGRGQVPWRASGQSRPQLSSRRADPRSYGPWCYDCGEEGHIAKYCPNQPTYRQWVASEGSRGRNRGRFQRDALDARSGNARGRGFTTPDPPTR